MPPKQKIPKKNKQNEVEETKTSKRAKSRLSLQRRQHPKRKRDLKDDAPIVGKDRSKEVVAETPSEGNNGTSYFRAFPPRAETGRRATACQGSASPAAASPRPLSAPHTGLGNGENPFEKITPPASAPVKSLATLQVGMNASFGRIMAARAGKITATAAIPPIKEPFSVMEPGTEASGGSASSSAIEAESPPLVSPPPEEEQVRSGPTPQTQSEDGTTLAIEEAQVKPTAQMEEGAPSGSACSADGKSGDAHISNSAAIKTQMSVSFAARGEEGNVFCRSDGAAELTRMDQSKLLESPSLADGNVGNQDSPPFVNDTAPPIQPAMALQVNTSAEGMAERQVRSSSPSPLPSPFDFADAPSPSYLNRWQKR
jgi:hypothetical protein